MFVFKNRRLLIGIASLVIVIGAAAAIWGVPKFLRRSTTVKAQVSSYLLDEQGAVNGLLLASGDQLRFSPETGALVASEIKIGDEVSASGHAGSQSSYGREIRVEQISANGRTILAVHDGPARKHERDHAHGPKGRVDRGDRLDQAGPPESQMPDRTEEKAPSEAPSRQSNDANAGRTPDAVTATTAIPKPMPEIVKVSATIRAHRVNGRGDVDGLILSSGEQVSFSPKVGKLVVTAEQGSNTQVGVEGTVVRTERGTVIRPTVITVGNQSISLDR